MSLTFVTLPVRQDNYVYLIHDTDGGETALVDVGDAGAILAELTRRGWQLSDIWLTHHHHDHTEGTDELVAATGAKVTGATTDVSRLPPLDRAVGDGESFTFAGHEVQVLDVSGHTVGHLAFYVPALKAVFTADSLMALGCGRLFEGSPALMFESLGKLAALPDDTQVCSGHEYTAANAAFALTIDPENAALIARADRIRAERAAGKPTVPSLLSEEKATNPYLRTASPAIRAHLGLGASSDAEVFAEIRRRKDNF